MRCKHKEVTAKKEKEKEMRARVTAVCAGERSLGTSDKRVEFPPHFFKVGCSKRSVGESRTAFTCT